MSAARWISTLVRQQPDLYRAIYDWNVYPHRWLRPEQVATAGLGPPVIALLERTSFGRRRLSRHFCTAFGLEQTWWDFQEPRRRLVLLSVQALEQLARFVGAAQHASALARIIARAERRALTDALGERAFAFGIRQSSRNRAPALSAPTAASQLGAAIIAAGWRRLAACVAEEPAPLGRRFQLKLPLACAGAAVSQPLGAGAAAWDEVQAIMGEALTPEERRCCN